jgi:membrane associated rhomboid family serine protease
MLEDRDYMRSIPGRWAWSATLGIILSLVVAFILQSIFISGTPAEGYVALSLEGMRHWFLWQLVTYQFLHGGWLHLLLNCWAIFVFGRAVEQVLGASRLLTLYFSGGIIGGLLQMLGAWLWPSHLGGAVVGASAGAFGLVGAFAAIDPGRELTMLLYFVLPIRIRAWTLVILSVALSGLGILFPNSFFGGGIAHAAHLGGLFTGLAWIKLGWHRDYVPLPWEGLLGRWRQRRRSQPRREPVKAGFMKMSAWKGAGAEAPFEPPADEFISREVDPILDKISEHGIQSLTEQERRILEAARSKMGKR